MRPSIRTRVGICNLLFAGGLIGIFGGCSEDKPAVAPPAETSVKANQSASAAWQAEKDKTQAAKK